ncbi:hypothetical protein RRG08_011829 [Elysia crispata]|uniref:Uncharacterized protein n=1 Tax=Elysia crispata TaxID=231223 RepID=A0AAE1A6U5_9GAST|nr:hypothetical protein RRG08_011829 [Elysia crispata]
MAQGRGSMWQQTGVRWDQGDVWNRCGGHKSGVGARHWSGSWWCGKIANLRALDVGAWVRDFQTPVFTTIDKKITPPTNVTATNRVATNSVATNSVTTNSVATNSVATNRVATNSVAPNRVATNSVAPHNSVSPNNSVAPNRVATNSVATNRVATNRVATNSVATNRVATNRVATNSVATNRVATNSVATNRVATNSVATNSVATNSVSTNLEIFYLHFLPAPPLVELFPALLAQVYSFSLSVFQNTTQNICFLQEFSIQHGGRKRWETLPVELSSYQAPLTRDWRRQNQARQDTRLTRSERRPKSRAVSRRVNPSCPE